jgi:hypothetical protein
MVLQEMLPMAKLFDTATHDSKQLRDMGNAIIAQFNTMKQHVHIWLCSTVLHTLAHNDYTEIDRVLDGCGDGLKRKAIYQWLTAHADGKAILPFKWVLKTEDVAAHLALDTDKLEAIKARYEADKDAFVALLVGLKPWYKFDLKNEQMLEFNLPAEIAKLIKRATKIAGDEKAKDNPKVNLKGLADLIAMTAGGKAAAAAAGQQVQ